jgi:hypothetical protein
VDRRLDLRILDIAFYRHGDETRRGTLEIEGISLSALSLLDVFLIFLLTFGIYMKSRMAVVGMFIYFLISKVIAWLALAKFDISVLIGIVFLYFFFEGARGAIVYHRLRQSQATSSPSASSTYDG